MEIIKVNSKLSNNYLIKHDNKVVLIDCACSLGDLQKLTTRLDAIIITHGHFDHFATVEEIQDVYKCPVFMHKNTFEKLSKPNLNASEFFEQKVICNLSNNNVIFLKEGKQSIAGLECEIFYAFGHTNDSILMAIENALFVGDFLFANGYGRCDLPTGSFDTMKQSLRKFLPLKKQYQLFYGHDS